MWKVAMEKQTLYLYGPWMEKDKQGPALSARGEKLAKWMHKGCEITAEEVRQNIEEYHNLLSDKPEYLRHRIDAMLHELSYMHEVMELNEMAHTELAAQEHYRTAIREGLGRLVNTLKDKSREKATEGCYPRLPEEQYIHGRKAGQYETFATCAQYVQDVVDQAALQVAKDDLSKLEQEG